jgi:plasmid stabilization system protein ParE
MDIIWMPEALIDLQDIEVYIAEDSAMKAVEVVQTIFLYATKQLETFPQSGRTGRALGTLELVVPRLPYFIPYRITRTQIEILRVYHTSKMVPEKF